MEHQQLLQNPKYRNWVKGGLAFKYFRDGFEQFADDIVKTEHTALLQRLGLTSTQVCTSCNLTSLRPNHTKIDRTCPLNQKHCNCLYPGGKTGCPNNVCGRLYDEIVLSHTSQTPCWKNGNINQWCSDPWEMAKCYINTPGYNGKKGPADIDITGLVQVLLNCTAYKRQLSSQVEGLLPDIRERRNLLFHSSPMELEEPKLRQWIDHMVNILKDSDINSKAGAQLAVGNLEELKMQTFIITTDNATEVCREAIAAVTQRTEELRELIQKVSEDIVDKHKKAITDVAEKQVEQKSKDQELMAKWQQAIDSFSVETKKITDDLQKSFEKPLQVLRDSIVELNEKYSHLENFCLENQAELQELKKTVKQMSEEMVRIIEVRSNHSFHLHVLEQRLELRQRLTDLFRKHYCNISACVLKAKENDINISDIYVWPWIKVERKKSQEKENKNEVSLKAYREIFETSGRRNRRIYMVGDMGSGKSVFCQKIINDWCNPTLDNHNGQDMSLFEFVFYIPLGRLRKTSRVRDMIHLYYKNQASKDVINDVLDNIPEKCLILADGLDEWIPGEDKCLYEHRTQGLPDAEDLQNITLLTTSRPSAAGMLQMKETEYDLKLKNCGIEASSLKMLIKNYVSQITKKECSDEKADTIRRKIYDKKICSFEHNPLLIQQIVWLLCNNCHIGTSLTEVYCTLLNISLRWAEKKAALKPDEFQNITLPTPLKKYTSCKRLRVLIYSLSRVAFEILVRNKGSGLTCGRSQLEEYGINCAILDALLSTGLLNEETCFDPTQEDTQFSFTHMSFLEFFAAVFVASNGLSTEGPHHSHCVNITQELFGNVKCVKDIFQLENVLTLACGLNSALTNNICQQIYSVANDTDEHYLAVINNIISESSDGCICFPSEIYILESLVLRIVRECKLNDGISTRNVPLRDILIDSRMSQADLELVRDHVDPLNIRHFFDIKFSESGLQLDVSKLQTIRLNTASISQQDASDSASIISRIRHFFDNMSSESGLHVDVSKLRNLQTICLNTVSISQQDASDLASFISTTKTLLNIYLKDIVVTEGVPVTKNLMLRHNEVDLSDHHDLQNLYVLCKVRYFCFKFIKTDTNPEKMFVRSEESQKPAGPFNLKGIYFDIDTLSTEETDDLVTCINNSVGLERLKLLHNHTNCNHHHVFFVDLSAHSQLKKLYLVESLAIQLININSACLTHLTANISWFVEWMEGSQLKNLGLENGLYKRDVNDKILTQHQLQELALQRVEIEDFSLEMTRNMKCLKHISLSEITISFRSWRRFLNKLDSLEQSINVTLSEWIVQPGVKTLGLFPSRCQQAVKEDFIRLVSEHPAYRNKTYGDILGNESLIFKKPRNKMHEKFV